MVQWSVLFQARSNPDQCRGRRNSHNMPPESIVVKWILYHWVSICETTTEEIKRARCVPPVQKKNWAHHWQITEDCAAVAGSLLLEDLWAARLQCRARPYLAGCRSGLAFGNVGKGKQKMVKNGTWKIDDIWWHWFYMIMTIYIMGIIPHTHAQTHTHLCIYILYIYTYIYVLLLYLYNINCQAWVPHQRVSHQPWLARMKNYKSYKKNMIEISKNIKKLKQIIKH